jgi:hypothetical protein
MEQSCEQVRVSITTEPSRVLSQASHPCVGRGNDGIQNEVKKGERDGPIGKRAILHRCKGLLVSDWFYDLKNPVEYHVKVLRCVQCGHRVDPRIVRNRIHPPVPDDLEEGLGYQYSVSIEQVEDAAF